MPPKRKAPAQDAETAQASSSAPGKRQRVSRACDQCRNAREKCDGIHPTCYSCLTLERECTYNDAPKKRGVQTGLIRTLESAIYWLFERYPGSEAALNDLLSSETGRDALSIGKRRDSGNRLHQKWRKCRTHKEIGRLLSGNMKEEASPRNSDEDESGTEPEAASQAAGTLVGTSRRRSYQLPRDVTRLLDIYFAYTHSWLPIVDKSRLLAVASMGEARDAELWSALAVASAQDPERQSNAADIHATACSLLPLIGDGLDDIHPDGFADHLRELQQVNGFLLLSLMKLGQDNASSASLLVGLAVRILLNLGSDEFQPLPAEYIPQKERTLMACFLLDSHVSIRLGQVPHLTATAAEEISPLAEQGPEEWEPWNALPGFPGDPHQGDSGVQATQSLSTFNQLFKFAKVLNRNAASRQAGQPGELAAALDPRFSWCNSVLETSAPILPTAMLLQASFLGSTLALSPKGRVSLLWNLMESVETAWHHLGPGTSPLLITYMGIANRRTKGFGGEDKDRWDALVVKLKSTWQLQPAIEPPNPQMDAVPGTNMSSAALTMAAKNSQPTQAAPYDTYHTQARYVGPATATSPSTSRSIPFTPGNNSTHIPGLHGSMMSPVIQMHPMLSFQGAELMIDHENILDELASFDCADNMEVDPQFMANLGFAPGSDYPDMRGDFGTF